MKIEIEYYAFFQNLDKSIIKFNPILKKDGFEFVVIDREDLETRFFPLFYLSKDEINVANSNERHRRIFNAIYINPIFTITEYFSGTIIFLKKIRNRKCVNKDQYYLNNQGDLIEIKQFSELLLQKLRYFKNGDVHIPLVFGLEENSCVLSGSYVGRRLLSDEKLEMGSDEEINLFKDFYAKSFDLNPSIEIADASFNLAYEIANPKIKFVILMTALESLFNQGKDQIAHTISRHLALIISKDIEQFNDNYKKIKQLYNLRNEVVHGSSNVTEMNHKIGDLTKKSYELQDLCRRAINYFRDANLGKKEMFDFLNSKGFDN